MKAFRRYLVAGILVWAPLAVTYLLLKFAVGIMDRTLQWVPARYQPGFLLQQLFDTAEPVHIPGLGVILAVAVLLLTGVLAANFVGRAFVGGWESLMHRIPVVRSIYSAAKHFAEVVFSDSGQSFKNVLLIEYPRKGLYSLAFQTSSNLGEVQGRTGEDVVCCFVPTTPNPTSGFIIVVPRKDITVLDMTVDEALRMIISLGVVVPTWSRDKTGELPLEEPNESA
ncbi:MAG: DUF502 domain-containing protein [Gammaproteobacteria bacterium]|nr:DUF502 domain-containing protein [Gammaproteobacteria bacterium]MDH3362979.1 DUF502 domain-containing protein [Gammaproteobacteria bacterium]MDH3480465.1 DUF502 domain-containing protein [Gammaproteobacteria bacterium]